MAYTALSAEQQTVLDDFLALLRPWCGEFARVHNHGSVCFTQYWATVAPVIALLQDTDEIPNKTNFAGAIGLTKAQLGTLLSWIESLAAINTEANRQLMAKAAGGLNLVG